MQYGHFLPRRQSGSFAVIEGRAPVAGIDYPVDAVGFERMFESEHHCHAFIERLRYPRGFSCEICGSRDEPWRSGTGLIACEHCRKPVPLTAGTTFHGSHISLRRWFTLLWEMTGHDNGISDERAHELLGAADFTWARKQLSRVREVMAQPLRRNPLRGPVHVGVTRLDDVAGTQPVLGVAIQDAGGDRARVRIKHLRRVKSDAVIQFVKSVVEPGAQVHTSGLKGFGPLTAAGFDHRVSPTQEPRKLASLAELWLWSRTPPSSAVLQGYLDDFTFRYNRRHYPAGLLFYRTAILAVMSDDPRSMQTELQAAG